MSNINFKIDEDKCVHCGKCSKDCVSQIIKMNSENIPSINENDEKSCIKCQHCLAICPVGAISILNKNPQSSEDCENFPNSEQLLKLIKSRRSIRNYESENLSQEIMEKLKNMLKYPPTGCNYHKLHFSIIDDVEVMNRFRNRTNNKIKKMFLSTGDNLITKKFARYKKAFLEGNDVIYRNAPHMIVVSSPINAPCANEDGIISLSYFELYAQSLGVGTLWCGFAQLCLKIFPDLCEFLEIPDNYKPVYVMLFGKTKVKYARTVQPEEYKITLVKGDKDVDNIPLSKKIKRYLWNSIR
jgi:Fe-S-cluster-containing hydrogenase component 2